MRGSKCKRIRKILLGKTGATSFQTTHKQLGNGQIIADPVRMAYQRLKGI